jgi:murein tripeptide amidase MpaA
MTTKVWPIGGRAPLPPVIPWSGRSEALVAGVDANWRTPAEVSGFDTTPIYEETLDVLRALEGASRLVTLVEYGRSVEGRPLTLVIASREPSTAAKGRSPAGPARVLTQCGIHPGEIDGKDAGLMLLRDIVYRGRDDLLEGVDWYFVPVVNPDGHERRSPFSRPNQRGPQEQGWRASAQGLNLNRDFVKLDSPEMRAIVELIDRIDPDLFIDLHVTDGLDYQYDITFGFQDRPYAASPAISAWLETQYRPAVETGLRDQGHIPGPLVLALDDRRPDLGLMLPAFPPRFSHSYGDLRHLATVLVENHSLKPVRQRILGTYVLLETSLTVAARAVVELREATQTDRRRRPSTCVLTWESAEAPVRHIPFHGVESEYYVSPASGALEVRWLGVPAPPVLAPLYGSRPALTIDRPTGYWVPASEPDVIDRLGRHGIAMTTVEGGADVVVDQIRLKDVRLSSKVTERRVTMEADCARSERRRVLYPKGSVYASTDQPLGDLVVQMLEPACPDSLFAQGFVTGCLQEVDYLEGYVVAPMAEQMLEADPELRRLFELELARDPAFAADPVARLRWFYRRSPYSDESFLLYPIGRASETFLGAGASDARSQAT